jgi:hypothetical protein
VQNSILIALMARGLTAGFASECFGQLTVQQPVIQSIGGNFAVSVPDRGGILLGSISRAGESRKSYGLPFTRGSSVGRFSQRSSLSSHVVDSRSTRDGSDDSGGGQDGSSRTAILNVCGGSTSRTGLERLSASAWSFSRGPSTIRSASFPEVSIDGSSGPFECRFSPHFPCFRKGTR